jgi:hypothetical protein
MVAASRHIGRTRQQQKKQQRCRLSALWSSWTRSASRNHALRGAGNNLASKRLILVAD